MNKKLLAGVFSISLLAAVIGLKSCGTADAATITLSWSFDYSVDPGCTATLTKNCVTGFEYGTTPDGGTTLAKMSTVSNPSPVPTILTNGITANFKQGPPYGSVVYYVRTAAVDGAGNPVFSSAAVAQAVQVVPGAPQSFGVPTVK